MEGLPIENSQYDMRTGQPLKSSKEDDALWVEFYNRSVENPFQTATVGRPIFETKTFVRIVIPGKTPPDVYDQEASEHDKRRFPMQWAAFKNMQGEGNLIIGTPLDSWSHLKPHRVAELRANGVVTVDQLAGLNDGQLSILGIDGYELRELAKKFLESADPKRSKLELENEQMKASLAKMQAQLEALISNQGEQVVRRRGRNRKDNSDIEQIEDDGTN